MGMFDDIKVGDTVAVVDGYGEWMKVYAAKVASVTAKRFSVEPFGGTRTGAEFLRETGRRYGRYIRGGYTTDSPGGDAEPLTPKLLAKAEEQEAARVAEEKRRRLEVRVKRHLESLRVGGWETDRLLALGKAIGMPEEE